MESDVDPRKGPQDWWVPFLRVFFAAADQRKEGNCPTEISRPGEWTVDSPMSTSPDKEGPRRAAPSIFYAVQSFRYFSQVYRKAYQARIQPTRPSFQPARRM